MLTTTTTTTHILPYFLIYFSILLQLEEKVKQPFNWNPELVEAVEALRQERFEGARRLEKEKEMERMNERLRQKKVGGWVGGGGGGGGGACTLLPTSTHLMPTLRPQNPTPHNSSSSSSSSYYYYYYYYYHHHHHYLQVRPDSGPSEFTRVKPEILKKSVFETIPFNPALLLPGQEEEEEEEEEEEVIFLSQL